MHIPSENYGLVTVGFAGPAVPLGAACTFGVHKPLAALDMDDLGTCAAAVENMHGGLSAAGVDVVSVQMRTGPNESGSVFVLAVSFPGVSGSTPILPNTALLIRKITALGGRKGRGRMFWPGCEESNIESSGLLKSGDFLAKDGVVATFFSEVTAGALDLVLFHGTDTPAPTVVTDLRLDAKMASQRDRMRR